MIDDQCSIANCPDPSPRPDTKEREKSSAPSGGVGCALQFEQPSPLEQQQRETGDRITELGRRSPVTSELSSRRLTDTLSSACAPKPWRRRGRGQGEGSSQSATLVRILK